MKHPTAVLAIQQAYPQLWFACHIEHRTRQSSDARLTDRDTGLLAHIAESETTATALARHLGIGKPALSQHLRRLHGLGLITSRIAPNDSRVRLIALAPAGRQALSQASALNARRLDRLLDLVPAEERANAVEGLQSLARAARALQVELSEGKRK